MTYRFARIRIRENPMNAIGVMPRYRHGVPMRFERAKGV